MMKSTLRDTNIRTMRYITVIVSFLLGAVAATQGQTLELESMQDMTVRQMPGLALAEKTADVAAVVDQRLVTIHVAEGQTVKKGQLLATLEYGVSRAEFQAAQAIAKDRSGVNIAQIDVAQAQSRLDRFRMALSTGAGNEMELKRASDDFDKSIAILQQEQARLVRAKKTAETAAAKVDAYIIRAPFSGIVTEQHVSVGNLVQAGEPVFSMVSASRLRVEMNLPLELFGKLKSGDAYEMIGGVPVSKMITADLKFVSPTIDSASQSFRCVFEIENQDLALPAGFPIQLSDGQVANLMKSNATDSSIAQK